ncbi:MAG: IS1634 family transposase, partial [Parafannyhessea umbonata]|nr:IS1634 family transposase [Parafannyhessea umbonata]
TNYYWEVDDEDPEAGAGAGLRRRGVSKEHRPEPIVQMGLLVDRNAVPIDYRLFPGNEHDGATMSEFVAAAAPGAGEVVWVADKGCNTRANMVDCVARGHHFLWSQSIRGTKSTAEMRSWVTSGEGYRGIDGDPDAGPGFRVKSRQDTLELEVADPGGETRRVPVEVKYVAFWSRKYQQRARRERARTVERAMDLVAHPPKYAAVTGRGAMRYVSARDADPETGEVAGPTQLAFDAEALAADEACDGYYLIVTSKTDMPDLEVIDTYRGLWRIEESFRITKSDLRARPVYLSRADHIEAHFLVCFTALTVVRLMQLAVRERRGDGTAPTAAQMLGDLSRVAATRLESNWWVFDHRTDLTDELFAAFGLEVPTRYMQLRDIRRLGAKRNAWKGLSGR